MKPITLFGALAVCLVLHFRLPGATAQITTFANPTPAADDNFSYALAAVGNDRVLIGAHRDDTGATNSGAVYLFNTNGGLLATFTNPTPAMGDEFGYSLAALGSDRVLIGAPGDGIGAFAAGVVYLFSTNGNLLTTFTNPTPAIGDKFGVSVGAVGNHRVLIGAHLDNTGANDAGAAYLFSTNGLLITTFTNPTPAVNDRFGTPVAAVGSAFVLIGAHRDDRGATDSGAVYLFHTNGLLITTFTNPTPADSDLFGYSLAAVGNDRVLIGAYEDDRDALGAGAAYLFSTNGALLVNFTNPTPAAFDTFGYAVTAVGTDRVLIGAVGDPIGTTPVGAAYLFNTNGLLITTFTNPTPAYADAFAYSVAAVGIDHVLIGATEDDMGATNAGVAYLFSTAVPTPAAPALTIYRTATNTMAISWPSPSTGWTLHQTTNGLALLNWTNAPGMIEDDGITKTLIVNPPTGDRFYRLFKP